MEESLVKLYNKLMSNYDRIPPGVSQPMVKAKSIDDVPILTLTLWSESPRISGYELRRVALELCTEIKKDRDVAEFTVIGGQRRQVRVVLDPAMLKAYGASAFQIMDALGKSNVSLPSGAWPRQNREIPVDTGGLLSSIDEEGNPTILATWTVIAALLPMAFVSGLMGPYMRPIPVGASAASRRKKSPWRSSCACPWRTGRPPRCCGRSTCPPGWAARSRWPSW
ncbi:MAG TPA: efflux RND transporter permease subunit [Syntrophales bacterium]|nr:efflux RND transporter permease subunit [Syntrophales bacterium]